MFSFNVNIKVLLLSIMWITNEMTKTECRHIDHISETGPGVTWHPVYAFSPKSITNYTRLCFALAFNVRQCDCQFYTNAGLLQILFTRIFSALVAQICISNYSFNQQKTVTGQLRPQLKLSFSSNKVFHVISVIHIHFYFCDL